MTPCVFCVVCCALCVLLVCVVLVLVCHADPPPPSSPSENTTPQMTRFRGAKVCSKWLQERIDDHNIQSDYKYKSGLQCENSDSGCWEHRIL